MPVWVGFEHCVCTAADLVDVIELPRGVV